MVMPKRACTNRGYMGSHEAAKMWTKVAERFRVRRVEEGTGKAFGQVPVV